MISSGHVRPLPGSSSMTQDERTFLTSRSLPYSPHAIYAAFESARLLVNWWGPDGFTNSFEVFEFKEGGRWRFQMHGPDGTRNTLSFG